MNAEIFVNLLSLALGGIVLWIASGVRTEIRDLRMSVQDGQKITDKKIDESEDKIFKKIGVLEQDLKVLSTRVGDLSTRVQILSGQELHRRGGGGNS